MLLILILPQTFLYWLLSKYRDGRFFFTYCMVDTVAMEIFYITLLIGHYTTPDSYVVMFLLRLIIYPVLEILIYKKMRTMYLALRRSSNQGWSIFDIISLLFYAAITLQMTYAGVITNDPDGYPVLILLLILMPAVYAHFLSMLRRQQLAHERSRQDSIMKVQVANMVARLGEIGEANEAFRIERHIEIKVLCRPKFVIMTRNAFDGNVVFDDDGIPQSTEEGHGFGTKAIATLCQKVGGYCDFGAEDTISTVFMHLK